MMGPEPQALLQKQQRDECRESTLIHAPNSRAKSTMQPLRQAPGKGQKKVPPKRGTAPTPKQIKEAQEIFIWQQNRGQKDGKIQVVLATFHLP